jgi:hypothetical protein
MAPKKRRGPVAEHVRSAKLNLRIAPRMKQRITALAMARKLSVTELLLRAFDAYDFGSLAPDVGDRLGVCKRFFGREIEASPGSRLSHAEVWAAFREWCHANDIKGEPGADDFAVVALEVCRIKQIPVRVRDNQVVCVDVRLKQGAPDSGEKDA